jgi:GPH family glycoside/pentoside/hexuronide:cation symporter
MTSTASTAKADSTPEVSVGLRLGWGIGTLGTAALFNTFSIFILFYLVNIVGLSPALAGTLIFVARIFDMAIDPPIGVLSDRTNSRWGRRRPWMFWGAFVAGGSFLLMFNFPAAIEAEWLKVVYVLTGFFFFSLGYSMFNVPYMAMPAEMTNSYNERTALMSFRVFFIGVGGFLAGGIGNLVITRFGNDGPLGYSIMSIMIASVVCLAMLACVWGTAKAKMNYHEQTEHTWQEQIQLLLSNKPFFMLICTKFCHLMAVSATAATIIFLTRNILGLPQQDIFWFSVTQLVASTVALPFWVWVAKNFGKRNAWVFAIGCFALTSLTWLLAGKGDPFWTFLLRSGLLGFFSAGILMMGFSILPDTIEYDYKRTGMRREGTFSAIYSFIENSASAFGPLAVGAILSIFNYAPSRAGALVEQTAEATRGVYVGASLLPASLMLLSCLFLFAYDLNEDKLKNATRIQKGA